MQRLTILNYFKLRMNTSTVPMNVLRSILIISLLFYFFQFYDNSFSFLKVFENVYSLFS